MKRLKLAILSAALSCALTVIGLWVISRLHTTDTAIAKEPARHGVSTASLLTQKEMPFSLSELKGKTVVLNFIFTHCPLVCPTQTRALARVRRALPQEVLNRVAFVSVSIDPEHDSPAALQQFARNLGVDVAGWTFVTGSEQAINDLSRAYSSRVLPEGKRPVDHRSEVRLLDRKGQLLMSYVGAPLDEARLTREIQTVDRLFQRTASL